MEKSVLTTDLAKLNFRQTLLAARMGALRPLSSMTVDEWADKYRYLSASAGSTAGRWKTDKVEVARGPMRAVTEPGVKNITAMTCTQLLKTSLLENVVGFYAHQDPCPMLLVEPKDDAVAAFSKERLAPMVRSSPVLNGLVGDPRTRRSEDTLRFKRFPGGFLAMTAAGSPTNLAMRAIRIALLDEIDKYETTKEGDPVVLAEERTATFSSNSLSIRACSPTWEETSRIFKSWKDGDMRRAYVECPECSHEQFLDFFRHVNWEKSDDGEHLPTTAKLYCEACSVPWTHAQHMALISGTPGTVKWKQTRPFTCCGVHQDPQVTRQWEWDEKHQIGYATCTQCGERAVPNTRASFQASKLYSPFTSVIELAEKWLRDKDDPETKQTFMNTQLGLPYHAQALKEIRSHTLSARREKYSAEVPEDVLILTAGVDVQPAGKNTDGRLEVEVTGWGLGEESWSILIDVIHGDPGKIVGTQEHPSVWEQLDKLLLKPFLTAFGDHMFIRAACVDSGGHNTQAVYDFCRPRIGRNIWAIKGASDRSGQWTPTWPSRKESKKFRTGYKPIILGVNAAKEAIRQKLMIEEPGPGYCHFHLDWTDARFDQLTSERLIIEKKAGVSIRKWQPQKGRLNEGLDVRVYSYAALCGLYETRKVKLESLAEQIMIARHNRPVSSKPGTNPAATEVAPRTARSWNQTEPVGLMGDTNLLALKARLEALKLARDTGVLTVKHGDTQTTFRSLKEIMEIIDDLETEIGKAEGKTRRSVNYIRQSRKGL